MKTHFYKLVLGFSITLFAFNLNAQDYEYIPMVKSGVQIWTTTASSEGYRHYNRFALTEEDTLIEGLNYKKLYWFTDSVFNPLTSECIGGLRENAQKQVFYKGKTGYDNEDWLNGMFFDFSLSVGDTFHYFDMIDIRIAYIDTIEIGGMLRKQFYITGNWDNGHIICKMIEGIGNDLGLLFDIRTRLVYSIAEGMLRCYEHNGDLQYMSEYITNCSNPFAGLNDIIEEDNSITLYPNPTSKEVNISSENIINSIEVFNSLGQKVFQTNVKQKGKTLDINSFSKGVYIIGVNTDRGYIRKKLIKN
ncbi:MAG: T9SS type A sorting domain-containing protein [Bacteroidales bacterium]|nr:T9SS type A sorting domain-containing protein [Bacteroidales bacterium]